MVNQTKCDTTKISKQMIFNNCEWALENSVRLKVTRFPRELQVHEQWVLSRMDNLQPQEIDQLTDYRASLTSLWDVLSRSPWVRNITDLWKRFREHSNVWTFIRNVPRTEFFRLPSPIFDTCQLNTAVWNRHYKFVYSDRNRLFIFSHPIIASPPQSTLLNAYYL